SLILSVSFFPVLLMIIALIFPGPLLILSHPPSCFGYSLCSSLLAGMVFFDAISSVLFYFVWIFLLVPSHLVPCALKASEIADVPIIYMSILAWLTSEILSQAL